MNDDSEFIQEMFSDFRLPNDELSPEGGFGIEGQCPSWRLDRQYQLYEITNGVLGRQQITGKILCCVACKRDMDRRGFNNGVQVFECWKCGFCYSRPLRTYAGHVVPFRNQGWTNTPYFTPRSRMTPNQLREYNRAKKARSRAKHRLPFFFGPEMVSTGLLKQKPHVVDVSLATLKPTEAKLNDNSFNMAPSLDEADAILAKVSSLVAQA